jgi:hypothetical protein
MRLKNSKCHRHFFGRGERRESHYFRASRRSALPRQKLLNVGLFMRGYIAAIYLTHPLAHFALWTPDSPSSLPAANCQRTRRQKRPYPRGYHIWTGLQYSLINFITTAVSHPLRGQRKLKLCFTHRRTYFPRRMKAYEEVIEFIAAGPNTKRVADFQASAETKARVESLIEKEKNEGLSAKEKAELDDYLQLEHLMRLVKARARQRLADE